MRPRHGHVRTVAGFNVGQIEEKFEEAEAIHIPMIKMGVLETVFLSRLDRKGPPKIRANKRGDRTDVARRDPFQQGIMPQRVDR